MSGSRHPLSITLADGFPKLLENGRRRLEKGSRDANKDTSAAEAVDFEKLLECRFVDRSIIDGIA